MDQAHALLAEQEPMGESAPVSGPALGNFQNGPTLLPDATDEVAVLAAIQRVQAFCYTLEEAGGPNASKLNNC